MSSSIWALSKVQKLLHADGTTWSSRLLHPTGTGKVKTRACGTDHTCSNECSRDSELVRVEEEKLGWDVAPFSPFTGKTILARTCSSFSLTTARPREEQPAENKGHNFHCAGLAASIRSIPVKVARHAVRLRGVGWAGDLPPAARGHPRINPGNPV